MTSISRSEPADLPYPWVVSGSAQADEVSGSAGLVVVATIAGNRWSSIGNCDLMRPCLLWGAHGGYAGVVRGCPARRAGDCGGCWGRASALSAASMVTCTPLGRSTWLLSVPRIAMSAPSGIRGASNAAVSSALRTMALEKRSDHGHSSS